jgi:hypothetical protein
MVFRPRPASVAAAAKPSAPAPMIAASYRTRLPSQHPSRRMLLAVNGY